MQISPFLEVAQPPPLTSDKVMAEKWKGRRRGRSNTIWRAQKHQQVEGKQQRIWGALISCLDHSALWWMR